jgi:hypothetical protein
LQFFLRQNRKQTLRAGHRLGWFDLCIEGNNSEPKQTMSNIITVQLPTETSYWGSTATEADVYRIIGNLETMIRSQFPDVDIDFQHMQEPRGRGIFGDDESLMDSIYQFIQDNWTAAL